MAVSLARRNDRRAWMEGSCLAPLRAMGVEAHFVDAIDGTVAGELPLPCIDGMLCNELGILRPKQRAGFQVCDV